MSDPNEQKDKESERDDLELQPEMVKDLDVGDDKTGQIRGGCSFTPIMNVDAVGTRSTVA